ncbi:MAG: hypothetical protein JWL77_1437 [Chthonomonadaceae bacterium]|nr:hypothetical protein [Chthonomonadaceae bacterium]
METAEYRAAVRTINYLVITMRLLAYENADAALMAALLDETHYCLVLLENQAEFEEGWRDHLEGMVTRHPEQFGGVVNRFEQILATENAKQ